MWENFVARRSAHKRDPDKKQYGGNFFMQAVYVGLDKLSAKFHEQGLINAFKTHILVNKIWAVSSRKITLSLITQIVLSNMCDYSQNELLNYIGK